MCGVALDLDGVVAPLQAWALRRWEAATGQRLTLDAWTTYSPRDCLGEEFATWFEQVFVRDRQEMLDLPLARDLAYYLDAEYPARLVSGTLVLTTVRPDPDLVRAWVQRVGLDDHLDGIQVFGDLASKVDYLRTCDVVIDDNPAVLAGVQDCAHVLPILVRRPWNADVWWPHQANGCVHALGYAQGYLRTRG